MRVLDDRHDVVPQVFVSFEPRPFRFDGSFVLGFFSGAVAVLVSDRCADLPRSLDLFGHRRSTADERGRRAFCDKCRLTLQGSYARKR